MPRQAGIADIPGEITFTPPYRVAEAVRGLEGFDYIWLLWDFSESHRECWSPTVRPPRLGGNQRVGVFATRSPFRPNPIGLSSVKLLKIEQTSDRGPVLHVCGADLIDGTPIWDIKPYLPYTDSHADARSGFAPAAANHLLQVEIDEATMHQVAPDLRQTLIEILAHDPRPQYQHDPERVYAMSFDKHEIHFRVSGNQLHVCDIVDTAKNDKKIEL